MRESISVRLSSAHLSVPKASFAAIEKVSYSTTFEPRMSQDVQLHMGKYRAEFSMVYIMQGNRQASPRALAYDLCTA